MKAEIMRLESCCRGDDQKFDFVVRRGSGPAMRGPVKAAGDAMVESRIPAFPGEFTDYGVCCSPPDTRTVRYVAYFGVLHLHILHLRQRYGFSFREDFFHVNVPLFQVSSVWNYPASERR